MTCACCGAYVPKHEQWWNRDTGYSLCASCPTWLESRGMDAKEMDWLYGKPGVHRPHPTAREG